MYTFTRTGVGERCKTSQPPRLSYHPSFPVHACHGKPTMASEVLSQSLVATRPRATAFLAHLACSLSSNSRFSTGLWLKSPPSQ